VEQREHAARQFVGKMVAKAIQSEDLAAGHYRRLSGLTVDADMRARLTRDADQEARHAVALKKSARRDGLSIRESETFDFDFQGVRDVFESCARRGDVEACVFMQDVFLEIVSIEFYGLITRSALRVGALSVAALVEKTIVPDERLHLAAGLREITRLAPDRAQRGAAFRRATAEMLPAMLVVADPATARACARTCNTCGDHCLKIDAEGASIPRAGLWKRMVEGIEDAARQIGVVAPLL
jgi:hypothetical protein